MKLGRSVFVHSSSDGFRNPIPAIVTQEYVANPNLVDVETFNSPNSPLSHCHPRQQVLYVDTIEAARKAFTEGRKWICAPYDPAAPTSFKDVEEAERKKEEAAATKAAASRK